MDLVNPEIRNWTHSAGEYVCASVCVYKTGESEREKRLYERLFSPAELKSVTFKKKKDRDRVREREREPAISQPVIVVDVHGCPWLAEKALVDFTLSMIAFYRPSLDPRICLAIFYFTRRPWKLCVTLLVL